MRRTLTLLIVLCLGQVLLISAQVQSKSGVPLLEAAAFGTAAGVQGTATSITDGISGIWYGYFALRGAQRENTSLRQRVLELEGQLQAEQARSMRTKALEEALALQESLAMPSLAARVIAGSPSPGTLTVTIDRGAADGVVANMAVIANHGVVGRVVGDPSTRAARVQLLVERHANAGAMLEKSGAGGIIAGGFADGLLRLELVQSIVDIAIGERVFTSGQDGIYPSGFLVGQVERIEGTGKSREIIVRPAVDFSRIDVVLLVRTPAPVPGGGA